MEEVEKRKICHQAGCKILEGGSCLESIDTTTQECPHFYFEEVTEEPAKVKPIAKVARKNAIHLFTGTELSLAETSLITNRFDSTLVVIIGESKSGKTTLLAEYFINFQKGPFKNFAFAGSFTQIGFEQRCFLATLGSKAIKPDTFKTGSMEFNFLHLALCDKNKPTQEITHLLLSDISGERYREAKISSTLMKNLQIVKQADYVLFMIDGHKIAEPDTRAVTVEDAKTFIQKALDDGIFNNKTKLKVAISKWDYLEGDQTFNFDQRIKTVFDERFANRLGSLEYIKIAARSEKPAVEAGLGMHTLLTEWCQAGPAVEWKEPELNNVSNRYFAKYNLKKH